jgi:hypothetical protein
VWLRFFDWLGPHLRAGLSDTLVEKIEADGARVVFRPWPWPWPLYAQVGGPGTPWQVFVVPPATSSFCSLIIIPDTEGGLFGASCQVFAGNGPREALLRALTAPAPVDPGVLFEAATKSGRSWEEEDDPFERWILLALAGLFALRFNLTEADKGATESSKLAFAKAAEEGQRALDMSSIPSMVPTDLLIIAAWQNLRRENGPEWSLARRLLLEAARRNLPYFAYALDMLHGGLRLLADAGATESDSKDLELLSALDDIRPYVEAAVPGRGYTSFFGRSPDEPTVEPLLGEPPYGRRLVTVSFPWP